MYPGMFWWNRLPRLDKIVVVWRDKIVVELVVDLRGLPFVYLTLPLAFFSLLEQLSSSPSIIPITSTCDRLSYLPGKFPNLCRYIDWGTYLPTCIINANAIAEVCSASYRQVGFRSCYLPSPCTQVYKGIIATTISRLVALLPITTSRFPKPLPSKPLHRC